MSGQVNRERVIKTFFELVALYSPSGQEREAADYVKRQLLELGIEVNEDDAGSKTGGNCGNLHAVLQGNVDGAPSIMLSAHLDVVEPCANVQPTVQEGVIQSNGTTVLGADDKAGVSVLLEALRTVIENDVRHGNMVALFTIGEESGLYGARHINVADLPVDVGYVLDSSGPPGKIISQAPGQVNIHAVISGKAAHAGIAPEKGISAIQIASQAIVGMQLGRIDPETTANIGRIEGGGATNIVPDRVEIWAEARSHDAVKLEIQARQMKYALETAAKEAGGSVDIEAVPEYQGYHLEKESLVARMAAEAARKAGIDVHFESTGGGSDSNIFNEIGIPTAVLGMGMEQVHTTQEHIAQEHLYQAAEWVVAIIETASQP